MTRSEQTGLEIGHPAPDRRRVSNLLLWFGLAGAAVAWSLQLASIAALAGVACLAGDGPQPSPPAADWGQLASAAINVAALLVSFAALFASYRSFSRTGSQAKGASERGVMDAGEGRARFIAIWGVFSSILFILAIGFNTVSVFWVGLCDI